MTKGLSSTDNFPGVVWNALQSWIPTTLCAQLEYYHYHVTDEELEAKRWNISPKDMQLVNIKKLGCELRESDNSTCVMSHSRRAYILIQCHVIMGHTTKIYW